MTLVIYLPDGKKDCDPLPHRNFKRCESFLIDSPVVQAECRKIECFHRVCVRESYQYLLRGVALILVSPF